MATKPKLTNDTTYSDLCILRFLDQVERARFIASFDQEFAGSSIITLVNHGPHLSVVRLQWSGVESLETPVIDFVQHWVHGYVAGRGASVEDVTLE